MTHYAPASLANAPRGARRALLALLATAVSVVPALLPAQGGAAAMPPSAVVSRQADSIVRDVLRNGPAAAASVMIVRGGDTLVHRAWGRAHLELDVPARPEHVFLIGSVTKQFTAAAIMRLVEQGRIELDADVRTYLSDYPTHGRTITVRHLLTHTSGIPSYTSLGPRWASRMREDLPVDTLIAIFSGDSLQFEPGARWSYNNSGYVLLGRIIEQVSGMPYDRYLQQEIHPRAGLQRTAYCHDRPIVEGRVDGYSAVGTRLVNALPLSMTQPYAAGSLCSTVRDLVRWADALEGGRVVSDESYAAMTTPVRLTDGSATSYGFGLEVDSLEGHARISHNGGINGFGAFLGRYPDRDLTVAVLVNTDGEPADLLFDRLSRASLGLPLPAAEFREPVVDLSAAQLAAYEGTYLIGGRLRTRVWVEDGELFAQADGQGAFTLIPHGDHRFSAAFDRRVLVTFEVEDGQATGFRLLQGGQAVPATRAP